MVLELPIETGAYRDGVEGDGQNEQLWWGRPHAPTPTEVID